MLHISLALWCEVFPDNFECLIRIIRRNRGSSLFALQNYLNELGLVLPVAVIRKPVIEVLAADSPFVLNSLRAVEGEPLYFRYHDGLGSGKREVVLLYDHEFLVDGHLVVVV